MREHAGDFPHRRACVALAAEHPHDERRDLGWQRGYEMPNGVDLPRRDDFQNLTDVVALRWSRSSEALVQDDAESPHVGAVIDVAFTEDLLGRHVERRSQKR